MAKPPTTQTTRPAPSRPATVIDLRKPLPTLAGPYSATELAAARAALASAMARLPIPVHAWRGPTTRHTDGTVIRHTDPRPPAFTTPAHPPVFVAHIPCARGAHHQYIVRSAHDLHQARQAARTCTQQHTTNDHHNALTRGVPEQPASRPVKVNHLADGLHRARAAAHNTQSLNLADIHAGLAARQTKEQNQP